MWKPPATGQIKVNVDGSFRDGSSREGIGGVFRDFEGKVLLQFSKEVRVQSAMETEVLAMRRVY